VECHQIIWLGLGLVLGAGAAMAQSADEQLVKAMAVFRPMANLADVWRSHETVTAGLAGRWLIAADAMLAGGASRIAPDLLKRGCARSGSDLTVSRYSITFSKAYKRRDGSSAVMETVYADHGGNVYGFMTDPEHYLDRLGMKDVVEEKHLNGKYMALRNASGQAHLFRPSPDILVIVPDGQIAQFAMRCP
jgi:hypothetical protein